MTEDEAKTKWCPMVNCRTLPDDPVNCIASDCACWVQESARWYNRDGTDPTAEQLTARTPDDAGLITVARGHCGLIK